MDRAGFYHIKKPVDYHILFLFYQIKTPRNHGPCCFIISKNQSTIIPCFCFIESKHLEIMDRAVFYHIKKPDDYHTLFLFYQIKTPRILGRCCVLSYQKTSRISQHVCISCSYLCANINISNEHRHKHSYNVESPLC
jgi:hypothetical protein